MFLEDRLELDGFAGRWLASSQPTSACTVSQVRWSWTGSRTDAKGPCVLEAEAKRMLKQSGGLKRHVYKQPGCTLYGALLSPPSHVELNMSRDKEPGKS